MMRLTPLSLAANTIFYLILAVMYCRVLTRRFSWPFTLLGLTVGYLLYIIPTKFMPYADAERMLFGLVTFPLTPIVLFRDKWYKSLLCAFAGLVAMAAADRPADGQDCTVVVLGCQVFPDGHPSLMLRGRINAAYDYLTAHPDALCIASGGQNGSEPISEAQCIRDTLVSMGIAPERILLEDQSASTEENLAFSAALLREKGLSTDVAIASDNFHQLRAAIWAQRSGLTPYSDGCASPWFLTAGYWARETAALLYMVVTGG